MASAAPSPLEKTVAPLWCGDPSQIKQLISDGVFEDILPGLQQTYGCSQGTTHHFEGDVATHTSMVVGNVLTLRTSDPLISFDDIDLLAALMHDIDKVGTRREESNGAVTFPGHEAKAAERIPAIAHKLSLSATHEAKLLYLVRHHGDAHALSRLSLSAQRGVVISPFWRNMRLLQKADALACYRTPDGALRLDIRWDLFDELRRQLC